MEIQPGDSVVVSLPALPANHSEKSAATTSIRKLWSTVTFTVAVIWSTIITVIAEIREIIDAIIELWSTTVSDAIDTIVTYLSSWDWKDWKWIVAGPIFVAYIILLPVTFTWKQLRDPTWKQILVISCIAISLDPFFFYIPIIDQDSKCLGVDYKLRNSLLVLRSVIDFARVLHIVSQIRDWDFYDSDDDPHADTDSYFELQQTTSLLSRKLNSVVEAIHERMPWLSGSLMIDILAVLPIPQVTIVAVFFKIGGSEFSLKTTILNIFLVFQYVPKICQIYLSSKKLKGTGLWLKGAFNFFLYILAGHVLASFWYFFSIQRETSCWHQACKHVTGCIFTYECGSNTPKIISLLNEQCPINSSNTTVFNFGIYLDILQSGNTGSTDFPRKFFYSLWWGVRNLSNFGTNLETSSHVWENCFAILIGLIGLLLFLYLIGNVQTYLQLTTAKSVEIEEKAKKLMEKNRFGGKYREMKMWMSSKGLPEDIKKTMRDQIKQNNLAENYLEVPIDLNFVENFSFAQKYLAVNALKKVPMFEKVDEAELTISAANAIIHVYAENSYVVRAGEYFEGVLFVIGGVIELIDTTGSSSKPKLLKNSYKKKKLLKKGDYYGDELLDWILSTFEPEHKDRPTPIHTYDVICITKVEAFYIYKSDLDDLVAHVFHNCGDTSVQNLTLVKRPLPLDTAETLNKINMQSKTIKLEEIEDSKQMEMRNMRSDEGRGKQGEGVAVTGASTSSGTVEQRLEQIIQIIQLQGDMLREQQNLTREDMGRRLDGMAAFLATLGYPGAIPPPPAP